MKTIRIATRASKLALMQSNYVRDLLLKIYPDIEISIVEVSTKGDMDKSDFLYKSDYIGFFTSEVEKAILDSKADIAVHSLKDLPTTMPTGLTIAAIPKRGNPADALVAAAPVKDLNELPSGSTVGTSSLRRISQLRHLRGDLKTTALRGNVETRISKVESGQLDAVVVAYAGLNRLGIADKISSVFEPSEFLPAPGQGALAVQSRSEDCELVELLSRIDDKQSRITTEAERYLLSATHGGCSIPLGAYARIVDNQLIIDAMIADVEGKKLIKRSRSAPLNESKASAQELAEELLAAGGKEILEQIRNENL